jgi:hypothetical protein
MTTTTKLKLEVLDIETVTFFNNSNTIYIPKKVEYNLRKYVSKKLLKLIDKDIDLAIEKCLVVISNLSLTIYAETPEQRWKRLHSKILHEQTRKDNKNNIYVYSKVIDVLLAGTKQKGAFIEINRDAVVGIKSNSYRLADTYFDAGLTTYTLKESGVIHNRNKIYHKRLLDVTTSPNPIIRNLLHAYCSVELPTVDELTAEGKRLVKLKTKTKKGKILTMRNKHNDSYWKDVSNRSFIEDSIELFSMLTADGLMMPTVGGEKSGGRVVDSFTLMPSWIRNLVKFDGEALVEADYGALHPNLCATIYKTNSDLISHDTVAEYLGVDRQVAKIEHLSFFNKQEWQMEKSPLFKYYMDKKPLMMNSLLNDKKKQGYKVTSKKLFKMEVELMTEVIARLSSIDIYVLYVYDALFATQKNIEMVTDVMNEVADEMDIKTIAS